MGILLCTKEALKRALYTLFSKKRSYWLYISKEVGMINHLNNLLIEGVLVNDPEIVARVKATPDVKLVKFTIANDYYYVASDGSKKKDTLFLPVQVWGSLAERCIAKMRKGMTSRCVGKLRANSWEDEDGKKHTVVELVARHIEYRTPRRGNLEVLEPSNEDVEEEELGETPAFYVI